MSLHLYMSLVDQTSTLSAGVRNESGPRDYVYYTEPVSSVPF